jgi:hypothetical protein
MGIAYNEKSGHLSAFLISSWQRQDRPTPRLIRLNTNNTRNTKNRILAIPAAPAAIPPKPNTPAIIATIRNITVHLNIIDKWFKFLMNDENLFTKYVPKASLIKKHGLTLNFEANFKHYHVFPGENDAHF